MLWLKALLGTALVTAGHAQTVFLGVSKYPSTDPDTQSVLTPHTVQNMPVLNMTSTDLRCRSDALTDPSIASFSVKANDVITLWWEKDSMSPLTGSFAAPMGPCTVYLARYASKGNGPQWFNVYKNGYVKGRWCSQTINELNNGGLNVRIPSDILYGTYLLRAEIIDLTNAKMTNEDDYTQGAGFFSNCIKIEIDSDGSDIPAGSYIPGIYTPENPSLLGDFSGDQSNYVVPGPAEYNTPKASVASGSSDTASLATDEADDNQVGMGLDDSTSSTTTSTSSLAAATTLPIANEVVNLN
ncbi:hypothetical protein GGI15_003987 [Coemansia interrupta]|uniref:lytic cellulose monooxygenase (C4-dehydrogenating) n=1 Tax=Coemansia interrupta TaxID=1126814 RepID=A0A9W8H8B4_9FUNG|nr:hypothetical protein GGI15_003987 [Coemansia interrupta]